VRSGASPLGRLTPEYSTNYAGRGCGGVQKKTLIPSRIEPILSGRSDRSLLLRLTLYVPKIFMFNINNIIIIINHL
jgi:hypothetical protein